MVDTDRYEGHTPGPWHFCIGYDPKTDMYGGPSPLKGGGDRVNGPVILSDYQFERGTAGHKADLKLIEDAPLLLEELKELREWKAQVERICRTMNLPSLSSMIEKLSHKLGAPKELVE
jgi:hypothetical protein